MPSATHVNCSDGMNVTFEKWEERGFKMSNLFSILCAVLTLSAFADTQLVVTDVDRVGGHHRDDSRCGGGRVRVRMFVCRDEQRD